jgi:hypothetical protein
MIDDVYVFDDIVDKEYQNKIKALVYSSEFSWYICKDVSLEGNPHQKRPGFKHNFVSPDNVIRSEFHKVIMPIIMSSLEKINLKKSYNITQGRAFLQLPLNIPDRHLVDTPHVDAKTPHIAVLYYVLDNEANTIIYEDKFKSYDTRPDIKDLKVKQIVKPKQGRVVVFNGMHWHTAEQPEHNERCIINYNVV